MASSRTAVFAWAMATFVTACGIPMWTDAVRARYSLTPEEMRRVQFVTSATIVLRREVSDQEKTIGGDGLQVRDGVRVEEVVIPSRTAGVAVRVEQSAILVSFSRQQADHALWFGVRAGDSGGPPELRRYELQPLANAASEPGPFQPEVSKGFLITYGGKKYRVADPKAWSVHLLYELDEKFETPRTREEPPGWRVREGVFPVAAPPASAKPLPPLPAQ